MGGDPIPGPHDWMVEWFEKWKNRPPRVKAPKKHHQPNYHGGS